MVRGCSSPTSTSSTYRVSASGCSHAFTTRPTRMSRRPASSPTGTTSFSSSPAAGAGFFSSTAACVGAGAATVSEEGEEQEQKRAACLVDLAADNGAKNEMDLAMPLQPTRVLARMGFEGEEGRRRWTRQLDAKAILAAAIIVVALSGFSCRRSGSSPPQSEALGFYPMGKEGPK